jgi:hypothetical protein
MQTSHFSDGHAAPFSIERKRRVVDLYDSNLTFNRIIEQKQNDAQSIVYSIDSKAMLEELRKENLDALYKITLACRQSRAGNSAWDVLFNEVQLRGNAACIFFTRHDYSPIPQDRIIYASNFLNFSMPITRSHLNHVITGDRFGISINDVTTGNVYVLLYLVEEFGTTIKIGHPDEPGLLIPGMNVKLEHALLLNHEGELIISSMEEGAEFNEEKAKPFVEWLIDTVDDIGEGFPWKPHFLPFIPRSYKRSLLEDRLLSQKEVAVDVSFDEFEEVCRSAYRRVRDSRRNSAPRLRPGARNDQRPHQDNKVDAKPPVVEIFTYNGDYYAHFALGCPTNDTMYRIPQDSLGKKVSVETFFSNKDLENILIEESSKVLVLSPDRFGDQSYYRLFSLSF